MKNVFTCPHCRAVLNPSVKIHLVISYRNTKGLILLSPQPGNYKYICDSSIEKQLSRGSKIRFSCPVCSEDLTSPHNSQLVELRMTAPGREPRRVEFRCPDPACNPYLALAVMLRAGMAGIEKNYKFPDPVELDVYLLSEDERRSHGIDCLPDSLYAAIEATAESKLVRDTFGDALFAKFLENKRIEWDNYRIQVTRYELAKYLPVL